MQKIGFDFDLIDLKAGCCSRDCARRYLKELRGGTINGGNLSTTEVLACSCNINLGWL